MCWQYKWQHGSSSTGSGIKGQLGLSNGVWQVSYDWQETGQACKTALFTVGVNIEDERVIGNKGEA